MFLIDTNIWLERLLDQKQSNIVARFLKQFPSDKYAITDFTFHSIGVILNKLHKENVLLSFLDDLFLNGFVQLVRLYPEDMIKVVSAIRKFRLDFDDAYQYVTAEKYEYIIISFDKDFDKTKTGRKTPEEILSEM